MQTEITLSNLGLGYTGLSYALREFIPIMKLLEEIKIAGFTIESNTSKVTCKVFEDDSGVIEISTVDKHRASIKHLNMKLHHFRDYVNRSEVTILPIGALYQDFDYLTKVIN